MTDTTARLALPLLHAAQAQKEFTHNEALVRLDALVGGVVAGGPLAGPPGGTEEGSVWIVGVGATGEWAGQTGRLAIASASGWRFADPPVGFTLARPDGAPVRRTAEGWDEGHGVFDRLTVNGHALGGGPAVGDPTGGEIRDEEARATIAALLVVLREQGLVLPSA